MEQNFDAGDCEVKFLCLQQPQPASPVTYWISVDHLNRPVQMWNGAKASVWQATWLPWGGVQSVTGTATLNARFPGQWFQSETGLHYNWHRSYDPTLGRYTQPDPLGFVDGPSVYGYAKADPMTKKDFDGRDTIDIDRLKRELTRDALCLILRDQVRFYCKNFPYSVFLPTNKCTANDNCETLERKARKRRDCIKSQTLLTNICYADDPNHEQRYQDESNAIRDCYLLYSLKGCGCLPD